MDKNSVSSSTGSRGDTGGTRGLTRGTGGGTRGGTTLSGRVRRLEDGLTSRASRGTGATLGGGLSETGTGRSTLDNGGDTVTTRGTTVVHGIITYMVIITLIITCINANIIHGNFVRSALR